MTAAAERAIYIDTGSARAFEAKRIDRFIQQHRAMLQIRAPVQYVHAAP